MEEILRLNLSFSTIQYSNPTVQQTMKRTLVPISLILMTASLARADFDPVPLTPGSFTADVVVESSAPQPLRDYTTATMDGGTNNDSNVWFEKGYEPTRPNSGVPAAGTSFAAFGDPNRTFKMPSNYNAPNALFLSTNGSPSGSLTLSTPTAGNALSLMSAVSGGDTTLNYTVHFQGGATESGQVVITDWFNTTPTTIALIPGARVNVGNGQVGQSGVTPRIFYSDIFLANTTDPVTSVEFTTSTGSRVAVFGISVSTDGSTFTPADVTGFNRDMVVEATAPLTGSLLGKCNVIMDSGATNLTGNTWYERGFNRNAPTTGLPPAGSIVTNGSPLHTFTLAPSYADSNVVYLGNYEGYKTAAITLTTPAAYTSLSLLTAAGNGPGNFSVFVNFQDGSTEGPYIVGSPDWFNGANPAFTAAGRFNPGNLSFANVNETNPRLYSRDVTLANTTSPVTGLQFVYIDGGRAMIFAVAGQTSGGGAFSPVPITGYTADGVIESNVYRFPHPYYAATTATMDGGTNFTDADNLNTWYEQGYYRHRPETGLPPAGTVITSVALPDHHYQMPASYTDNNAAFIDSTFTNVNLTLAEPATYSALSFLSTCANGRVTNQVVIQYEDGTAETNTFVSQDWFNNSPYAFTSRGRTDIQRLTLDAVGGDTPRLFEAQFALNNTTSSVTNINLRFLGSQNSGGRMFVFGVSGTAGDVPPIISSVTHSTINTTIFEGSNVTFTATLTGGTTPISYQWQKGTNGVFVDLSNGGKISGATTTNMTITGVSLSDMGDYRLVASNVAGSVNSGVTTLARVLSNMSDITSPNDQIDVYLGTTPFTAEVVTHAIDNNTQKYLSVDPDDAAPFDPVGFIVQPSIGNTIVTGLRIYAANDAEGRDPTSFTLEGSLDGGSYTAIASGSLALSTTRNTGGQALDPLTQNLQEVHFANTSGYTYYRVTFNTTRDANSTLMQIGEIELLGVLNPNSPPFFTVVPADTTANEGTTATIYSLASGAGPITYQWYDVTGGDPGVALAGQTSANLVLPSVTTSQSGSSYRVVATNPFGSTTSPATVLPAAQLTVNSGPISITQDLPAETLFYAGRTVSIAVGASGTSPAYQWQKDGVDLPENAHFIGTQSNVLTIANIGTDDAGSYQVFVSNDQSGVVPSSASTVYVTTVPTFHGNGLGWTVNGGTLIQDNVLYVTTQTGQATSGFFNIPLYVRGFDVSYIYQDIDGLLSPQADGMAFVLQNADAGPAALGGGGGALGYNGIQPSVGVLFNIYTNSSDPGIAFTTNGVTGGYQATPPVPINSGDPIYVNIHYVGSTLTVTLSNTLTAATFSTNMLVGDLTVPLGGSTAYVGITGATGGTGSNQRVSNFRYIPLPTLSAQRTNNAVRLAWPATVGGYGVESKTDLTSPAAWSTVGTATTQTNGQNQVIISPATGNQFFRLKLPIPE